AIRTQTFWEEVLTKTKITGRGWKELRAQWNIMRALPLSNSSEERSFVTFMVRCMRPDGHVNNERLHSYHYTRVPMFQVAATVDMIKDKYGLSKLLEMREKEIARVKAQEEENRANKEAMFSNLEPLTKEERKSLFQAVKKAGAVTNTEEYWRSVLRISKWKGRTWKQVRYFWNMERSMPLSPEEEEVFIRRMAETTYDDGFTDIRQLRLKYYKDVSINKLAPTVERLREKIGPKLYEIRDNLKDGVPRRKSLQISYDDREAINKAVAEAGPVPWEQQHGIAEIEHYWRRVLTVSGVKGYDWAEVKVYWDRQQGAEAIRFNDSLTEEEFLKKMLYMMKDNGNVDNVNLHKAFFPDVRFGRVAATVTLLKKQYGLERLLEMRRNLWSGEDDEKMVKLAKEMRLPDGRPDLKSIWKQHFPTIPSVAVFKRVLTLLKREKENVNLLEKEKQKEKERRRFLAFCT
ncbi:hypothetical protein HDU76_007771, partial [Blyttiomyces sp. JEL0837]